MKKLVTIIIGLMLCCATQVRAQNMVAYSAYKFFGINAGDTTSFPTFLIMPPEYLRSQEMLDLEQRTSLNFIENPSIGNRVYGVMLKKGDDSFWGAVNRRGEVVIPIKYDVLVGDFWSHKYGHVILCDTKGKVGMMNFDGTVAIPFNYDGFGDEWDHVIVARLARKSYILIDKSGRWLTPLTYERIWGDDELHIVGLRNNKEYRLSIEGKETGLQK